MTFFKNKEFQHTVRYILTTIGMITAATAVGYIFRIAGFPETNIVIVYLLSILLTARMTQGYVYGILSSILSTCMFNYFFISPHYTLSVNDPSYVITFVIMTLTAFITSTLTSKVKKSAMDAQNKESETSALFHLTNRLTDAVGVSDIANITADVIGNIMNCRAVCLCFDEEQDSKQSFIQRQRSEKQDQNNIEDISKLKLRMEELLTAYYAGDEYYDWPIYGRDAILGVLRIPAETAIVMRDRQKRLLRSMIESTALALDRFRSVMEQQKSKAETEQERFRGNLLRAIFHDLRTPLSGIMGTSEMLMGMTEKEDERYSLETDIYKDADWLHSMVENILNLTRLQDGKLVLNKQMEAVEEVVGVAVASFAKRAPECEIVVKVPDEMLLVPMDARLIEQTLVNLIDNAIRNTTLDGEVDVCVRVDNKNAAAVFTVTDHGTGITAEDMPHIFEMFYTTHKKGVDGHYGVGLGLAICKSIISAHGGIITANNRKDGPGAEFVFTLPLEVNNSVAKK